MDLWIIRVFLFAAILISGFYVRPFGPNIYLTFVFGIVFGLVILFVEYRIRALSLKTLLGGAVGSLLGIIGASLVSLVVGRMNFVHPETETFVQILILILMTYIGMLSGAGKGEFLDLTSLGGIFTDSALRKSCKVLDTSVIIDGRVAAVAQAGFLEGMLYIPSVVLGELQGIADSGDPIRRRRGRRGLVMLNKMQKEFGDRVAVLHEYELDIDENNEVDIQLVHVAKELGGALVTNDFNLSKVAGLHGVPCMNVNELAAALKPIHLHGEELQVVIAKEGREPGQGVAYLEDGTMVVVEGASDHVGDSVIATVTSMIQTTAGKMVFATFAGS